LSKIKITQYTFQLLSYTYTYVLSKFFFYKNLSTSSTDSFVAAVRPYVAVVSVGLASPFGHPDRNVVARWRAVGAQVLQTGRSGTITVSTDGQDLKVETFVRE
jgi:beta-lactamase superfamily II metal-dependent hydrolase